MTTIDPFADRAQARSRTPWIIGAIVLLLGVAALLFLALKPDPEEHRTVIAIDATVQLTAEERTELLERRVDEHFTDAGEEVAVFSFGADGSEADQRLDFTDRSTCEGPACKVDWKTEADRITNIAGAVKADEATGSGILEGVCSLPLQPGDTLLLVSDLAQRTASIDLISSGKITSADVDDLVARARDAGLVCDNLDGVDVEVLGFGSDGRTGDESAAIEAFWVDLANEAGASSVSVERFGA